MDANFLAIFSLINLGFFGGFTHCTGMCGPFVLTQVGRRLEKTSLDNFSNFQKIKNLALLPYQAGRITTYSLLAFLSALFAKNIEEFFALKLLSAFFLALASLFFFGLFFEKKILDFALLFKSTKPKISLPFWRFFKKILSSLFQDPRGLRGFFLGAILGFIPCGLIYAALLICATISSPFLAMVGMIFFGISTFPALFLTACGTSILTRIPEFKFIARILILINALMLLLMSLKALNN